MHCIHTAEDSVKLHVHPGIDIALFVLIHSAGSQFQAEPFHRGIKYTK